MDAWRQAFATNGLDCVIDPMVVRAAELFIGGRDYCRQMTGDAEAEFWPAIENNLDGVLTFFHISMTRDRIPLMDCGETFITRLPEWLGSSILLLDECHKCVSGRQAKATQATRRRSGVGPSRAQKPLALDRELLSVGYFWQPSLGSVQVAPRAVAAAQFVLGGLIFGASADAAEAVHVLQSKRLHLMTALNQRPADTGDDWHSQEQALFAEIARLANRDKALRKKDEKALPSVLLHLLAQGIKSPRALLDDTLALRDSSAGKSYRQFHKRLRDAWRLGRRDADAEQQIKAVASELKRRISGKPTILTHIIVDGSLKAGAGVKANVGLASAHVTAAGSVAVPKTQLPIAVPSGLRNWFVDNVLLSQHQKLLLRMANDQYSFANVKRGLRTVWHAA